MTTSGALFLSNGNLGDSLFNLTRCEINVGIGPPFVHFVESKENVSCVCLGKHVNSDGNNATEWAPPERLADATAAILATRWAIVDCLASS